MKIGNANCSPYDCKFGTCALNDSGSFCQCFPGFRGASCDININDCESSPCAHGICIDYVNAYVCNCSKGYQGSHCDILSEDPCKDVQCLHGYCSINDDGPRCVCSPGFSGEFCNETSASTGVDTITTSNLTPETTKSITNTLNSVVVGTIATSNSTSKTIKNTGATVTTTLPTHTTDAATTSTPHDNFATLAASTTSIDNGKAGNDVKPSIDSITIVTKTSSVDVTTISPSLNTHHNEAGLKPVTSNGIQTKNDSKINQVNETGTDKQTTAGYESSVVNSTIADNIKDTYASRPGTLKNVNSSSVDLHSETSTALSISTDGSMIETGGVNTSYFPSSYLTYIQSTIMGGLNTPDTLSENTPQHSHSPITNTGLTKDSVNFTTGSVLRVTEMIDTSNFTTKLPTATTMPHDDIDTIPPELKKEQATRRKVYGTTTVALEGPASKHGSDTVTKDADNDKHKVDSGDDRLTHGTHLGVSMETTDKFNSLVTDVPTGEVSVTVMESVDMSSDTRPTREKAQETTIVPFTRSTQIIDYTLSSRTTPSLEVDDKIETDNHVITVESILIGALAATLLAVIGVSVTLLYRRSRSGAVYISASLHGRKPRYPDERTALRKRLSSRDIYSELKNEGRFLHNPTYSLENLCSQHSDTSRKKYVTSSGDSSPAESITRSQPSSTSIRTDKELHSRLAEKRRAKMDIVPDAQKCGLPDHRKPEQSSSPVNQNPTHFTSSTNQKRGLSIKPANRKPESAICKATGKPRPSTISTSAKPAQVINPIDRKPENVTKLANRETELVTSPSIKNQRIL